MRFTVFIAGVLLLAIGLAAYSMIPNNRTLVVPTTQQILGPSSLEVNSASSSDTPTRITPLPGQANEFRVNITALSQSGFPGSVRLKIFTNDSYQACSGTSQGSGCLFNRVVSNETVRMTVNSFATYHFVLDNTDSSVPKRVLLSVSVVGTELRTTSARDGSFNFAGLGLGLFGFIVAVYGASRKTVIPWE
ncbi:MAG TPA: hypothetical protein VFE98_01625 [Candidatus Bathyarchaeia archaeon]|nr:hypothetical protein [Candidatus Bathyarchaeia archaeon]